MIRKIQGRRIASCFAHLLVLSAGLLTATTAQAQSAGVSVQDEGSTFILSNPFLSATVSKVTGDLVSLKFKNLETMGYVSGHHAGYWEQNPSGAKRLEAKVTIDPASNHGERAEVSIKGCSDGESLDAHRRRDPATSVEDTTSQLAGRSLAPPPSSGRAPNAGTNTGNRAGGARPQGPGLLLDMEIRYTLGREDHGIYTYAIFTHQPTYGATQLGESRFGMKLNQQVFDWLSIDAQRNAKMPTGADWDNGSNLNMKEARRLTTGIYKGRAEHKYDYCADQFETPAFGWASTAHNIGIYFINPSSEFLSSGPFHFELTGHLDDGDGGDPTLLDYWRGTHYGGSELPLAANEDWNKVVGPIFLYLASGPTPDAMFQQAREQAKVEQAKWPYTWVAGADYPQAAQRSTVRGRLILRDPQASSTTLPNLMVGLAYPDQVQPEAAPLLSGNGRGPQPLTWQNDAKHYEFWVHGSPDGSFTIPKVRPGRYELHAVADGVLGEFHKADITIGPGGEVDLGSLDWKPVRFGRQLWQIGVPNRSASEFLLGEDHWHWGLYLKYASLFPNDVNYTVGKSDWRKDWFIFHVPHAENDDGTARGQGRATPWTVHFNVGPSDSLDGQAVLRLALSAVSTRTLQVTVNGKPAGEIRDLVYNATINRDGIEGSWVEKDLAFPARMLHPGENTLTLTVPAGGLTSGVAYDVLRLELAPAP